MKQAPLFKNFKSESGGRLRSKIRSPRPLSSIATLHLIVKSNQATGRWAFNSRRNRPIVERILNKFADRFGISLVSTGIVTNHVHLHLRLPNRTLYKAFIRAFTAALTFAITGHSRWNRILTTDFFEQRPYSRIVAEGKCPFEKMENYTAINFLEGLGLRRAAAEAFVKFRRQKGLSVRPEPRKSPLPKNRQASFFKNWVNRD